MTYQEAKTTLKEILYELGVVYRLDYLLGDEVFVLYVEEERILEVAEALEGLDLGKFRIELKLR